MSSWYKSAKTNTTLTTSGLHACSKLMEITYIGHSSFKLKGKSAVVATDPYDEKMVGLKFPKIEADIVTVSHQHEDHNNIQVIEGTPVVITGPGEYEIKGVKIVGVATFHDDMKGDKRGKNTVYHIKIDGISIVHCGDLGHKLDDKKLEMLDGVDILMVPVGGFYTLSASEASELASQLDPKIIIPMHYNHTKLNQNTFGQLSAVDVFLKEMGKEGIQPVEKLVVTKEKLPAELTVVVLELKN